MGQSRNSCYMCPFFINAENKTISCQGMAKGAKTVHKFRNKQDYDKHRKECCMTDAYGYKCDYAFYLIDKYAD